MSGTIFNYKNLKKDFTKESLLEKLEINNLTYRELENKYKYNERLFSKLAKEYCIPKNTLNISKNSNIYHQKNYNISEIIDLYVNKGMSLKQIATLFKCQHSTIEKRLKDNGIPIRSGYNLLYYGDRTYNRVSETGFNYRTNTPYLDAEGYIRIGQEREHRLVMEKSIGRKLTSIEHVHHIDRNKINNVISNLFLFATGTEHLDYHGYINTQSYIEPQEFLDTIYPKLVQTVYDYNWLYYNYITLIRSANEISKSAMVSRLLVTNELKMFDIYKLREPTVNQYD